MKEVQTPDIKVNVNYPDIKAYIDFTKPLTEIIDGARSLSLADKNEPDLLMSDVGGDILIASSHFYTRPKRGIEKISQKLGLSPQKVGEVCIFYTPFEIDNNELVSLDLRFKQIEWNGQKTTELIKARTKPMENLEDRSKQIPQENIYPIYARDTIDWSKTAEWRSIDQGEVVNVLEKIKRKINLQLVEPELPPKKKS